MTSKINIKHIFLEHIDTFRDQADNKFQKSDFIVMLGLPYASSLFSVSLGFRLETDNIGILVSVFSIFAGLLFNVLVLIYSINIKPDPCMSEDRQKIQHQFLAQCFSNISFAVMISLLTVVVLAILIFSNTLLSVIFSAIFVFLALNFTLTLLMILKRIHALFQDKFR